MGDAKPISRRQFLQATGWTAAGVTVTFMSGCSLLPVLPTFSEPDESSGIAWVQISPQGRAILFCPRQEMGQGASIGLAQIVAEELNLDVAAVEVRIPSTEEIPPVIVTAGSRSIALFSAPTARAAAALREVMRARAARHTELDPSSVADADGGFSLPDGRFLGYGELAGGEPVLIDEGELCGGNPYTFEAGRRHRQVGQGAKPFQIREIVSGGAIFASDVRVPDMLYGRALRPPVRKARLTRIDDSAARAVPGVIRTVLDRDRGFAGVVAETPAAVEAAIEKLEVEWALPTALRQDEIDRLIDVDAALAEGDLEHVLLDDRMDPKTPWDLDLRIDVQTQSHAMQEPRAAVARFGRREDDEIAEIWTGSQDPFFVQRMTARALGLSTDRVVVHPMRMGGGFGGREGDEVERDALLLARAAGQPVKVQWSRADEFRAARNRPPSSHRLRIRTDADGRISDWWHALVSGHIIFAAGRAPRWLLSVARITADLGVSRGALPPYAASRKRVELQDTDLPLDLGSWRSLGAAPNTFAIECAVDELARQRGEDPVEFRLRNLPPEHARLAACLRRARELAERRPLPAGPGHGRGFACGIYEEHSFVATSADVHADTGSGAIRVLRACCVQDVGLAINPDQLRAQIEGNLMWGIGMALLERVVVGPNGVTSDNFDSYRIPQMQHSPEMEIEIISDPSIPPAGAGETGLISVAPAIANALREATNRRYTRLPIRLGD